MRVAQITNGVVVNVVEVDPAKRPAFTNGWPEAQGAGPGWRFSDGVFSPPADVVATPTAADLLATLAERRYAAEESGTTFEGYPLATDRVTQSKITAAYVKAIGDPNYTISQWKFGPGVFAPLDATMIIGAANAMEAHVQACFANEAAISALILAAGTPEALAMIDLDAGWP